MNQPRPFSFTQSGEPGRGDTAMNKTTAKIILDMLVSTGLIVAILAFDSAIAHRIYLFLLIWGVVISVLALISIGYKALAERTAPNAWKRRFRAVAVLVLVGFAHWWCSILLMIYMICNVDVGKVGEELANRRQDA